MSEFLNKNRIFLFGAVLLLSFVWAGRQLKKSRDERMDALTKQAESAAATSSQSAAVQNSSRAQEPHKKGDLIVLSQKQEKDGTKTIELSDKTQEQINSERRTRDVVMVQAKKKFADAEKKAIAEVQAASQKQFKPADVHLLMEKISTRPTGNGYQISNDYAHLRNEVFLSRTPAAEKAKLLQQIDAKMAAIPMEPFKGYDSAPGPNGSVLLVPK